MDCIYYGLTTFVKIYVIITSSIEYGLKYSFFPKLQAFNPPKVGHLIHSLVVWDVLPNFFVRLHCVVFIGRTVLDTCALFHFPKDILTFLLSQAIPILCSFHQHNPIEKNRVDRPLLDLLR